MTVWRELGIDSEQPLNAQSIRCVMWGKKQGVIFQRLIILDNIEV